MTTSKARQTLNSELYRKQIKAFLSQTKEAVKVQQSRKRVSSDLVNIRAFCEVTFCMQQLDKRLLDLTTKTIVSHPYGLRKVKTLGNTQ
jgi:hypothetical protein